VVAFGVLFPNELNTCGSAARRATTQRRWVHTHSFLEKDGGTLCRNFLEYAVLGGHFVNWLLVKRDMQKIFRHRQEVLQRHFPRGHAPPRSQE